MSDGLVDEGTLEVVALPPEPVARQPDPDYRQPELTGPQRMAEVAATVRPPGLYETSIEMPFRLMLSLAQDAAWRTPLGLPPIAKLAAATWPNTGKPSEFAANIQRHIQGMKRMAQPRSIASRRGHPSLWAWRIVATSTTPFSTLTPKTAT